MTGNCKTICWAASGAGGLLLALLIASGERGFFSAVLIGALVAVAAAMLLQAYVCNDGAEAESSDSMSAAPAPRAESGPAAPAAVAGSKAVAPELATSKTEDAHATRSSGMNDSAVLEPAELGDEVSEVETLDQVAAASEEVKTRPAEMPMPDAVAADYVRAPKLFEAPRDGEPDDLKQLRGVGPKLEEQLNRIGVWHLDQIASWTEAEAEWIDGHLEGFKGRVMRDDWIGQARELMADGADK